MFGQVQISRKLLTEEASSRYDAFYCGLCRAISTNYGFPAKFGLSFDLTFLTILLSSLHEPEEKSSMIRCAAKPSPHTAVITRDTDYCAAMNTLLLRYKCLDDFSDDHSVPAGIYAALLKSASVKIQKEYPEKADAVGQSLRGIADCEKKAGSPDAAANLFGDLLGEIFVPDPSEHFAGRLRELGKALGRFIYLADAACDLKSDLKKGSYNPFSQLSLSDEDIKTVLEGYLDDASDCLFQLPLIRDIDILNNILYDGIRGHYLEALSETEGKEA